MLPLAHGHQLKAIAVYVFAIIEQQMACQAQLARYVGNQKAAAKGLSRLLHNEGSMEIANKLVEYLLKRHALPPTSALRSSDPADPRVAGPASH
jgi:hypothetical protein